MVRDRVIDLFRRALAKGAAEGLWPALEAAFSVEAPRDPKHGDFAVNAAMVLAKPAGKPPRELAQAIVAEVRAVDVQGELAARHDLLVAALLRRGRAPRCARCGASAPARAWRCRRCGAFGAYA